MNEVDPGRLADRHRTRIGSASRQGFDEEADHQQEHVDQEEDDGGVRGERRDPPRELARQPTTAKRQLKPEGAR